MSHKIKQAIEMLENLNQVVGIIHDNEGIKAVTEAVVVLKEAHESSLRKESALKQIAEWNNFPSTDSFWDEEKTKPMSYSAAYGSNGERNYMRRIAEKALKE